MLRVFVTSAVVFFSTNVDNIFVLFMLYSKPGLKRRSIFIGEYIAIGGMVAISVFAARGLRLIPEEYIFLLGFLPIALGIKSIVDYKRGSRQSQNKEVVGGRAVRKRHHHNPGVLSVTGITLAQGADNIGIYTPVLKGYDVAQTVIFALVFVGLLAALCFAVGKLVSYEKVKAALKKYEHIVEPAAFAAIGLFIIFDNLL